MAAPGDVVKLEKELIKESFQVQALRVPSKRTGELLAKLRAHLLNLPRRKNVEPAGIGENFLLFSKALTLLSQIPSPDGDFVQELLATGDATPATFTIERTYESFTAEEVLKKLLPAGVDVPSSFEQAGHLCHLNLRDSQLPYRFLIAQVILDKNKSLKTIVNKTGKIETEFRTFPMEILAGDPSTVVRLKEHDCWFEFEYRDVYWNSRLQEEHGRLIEALFYTPVEKSGRAPVIADCTCGVGPFSIPVTKQTCNAVCHANDLNPASVHWLERNAVLNKLPCVNRLGGGVPPYDPDAYGVPASGSRLVIHEPGDARVFVRALLRERHPVSHALFNLPATGIELLDTFRGLDYVAHGLPRPLVCCYTFSDAAVDSPGPDGAVADLLRRLAVALDVLPRSLRHRGLAERPGLALPSPQVEEMIRLADDSSAETVVTVRLVRNVAPNRYMFCVCFRVPVPQATELEPSEKRAKLD